MNRTVLILSTNSNSSMSWIRICHIDLLRLDGKKLICIDFSVKWLHMEDVIVLWVRKGHGPRYIEAWIISHLLKQVLHSVWRRCIPSISWHMRSMYSTSFLFLKRDIVMLIQPLLLWLWEHKHPMLLFRVGSKIVPFFRLRIITNHQRILLPNESNLLQLRQRVIRSIPNTQSIRVPY